MVKVTRQADNSRIINVGSDYRIEPGPKLVTAIATPELLHNDRSASHYAVGMRDARGRPIVEGQEMTYLEWGGNDTPIDEVYYIYRKVSINNSDEFINGEINPNFVAEHVREAAKNGERGDDRVYYDYKWEEVGTRATEEAAIAYAEKNAS